MFVVNFVSGKIQMVESLCHRWKRSGIREGDIVLIHSDITRTIIEYRRQTGCKIGPSDILDSFLDAVGPTGTLLFPLFNFDFTIGCSFDIRSTPSQMGALTEVVRKRPDAIRTGHPVYSFGALGKESNAFQGVNNRSAYSDDSPFGILKQLAGKIAVLDLPDSQSMTFYHHIEEVERVDFRYFKDFSGQYTDEYGLTTEQTYSIYVRDLDRKVLSNADPAGEMLWKEGLYKGYKPLIDTGLRTINAQTMFNFIKKIINDGRAEGLLYEIEK